MNKKTVTENTKLLYIAYADALEGKMAKIGITQKTFEERWAKHNSANPDCLDRKEYFSIRLRKEDAEMIEDYIKSHYTAEDAGEWVAWSPDHLKQVVIGLIMERVKDARRDLARVLDGRKQRDFLAEWEIPAAPAPQPTPQPQTMAEEAAERVAGAPEEVLACPAGMERRGAESGNAAEVKEAYAEAAAG